LTSSSARGPCTAPVTQVTTSAGLAAPAHARTRSVWATSPPGHLMLTLLLSLLAAVLIAPMTVRSAAQSAGVPVIARLSRHLVCALYRASKYFWAADAMAS